MANSNQTDLGQAFNLSNSSQFSSASYEGVSYSQFGFDYSKAFKQADLRGEYEWTVANPCKPGTISEIDTTLRNFFNFLKGLKEEQGTFFNEILSEAQNLTYEISKVASKISAVLRTFTQKLRNFIMQAIKELLQGAIQSLLTPLLDQIKDSVIGAVLDQLMCKFDEIMNGLKDLAADFLFALVNLAINNPALCAIEAFTNALLNNLANTIDNAIQPVLNQIGDLLSGAAGVVGSVFSVIDQVLAFEGFLCSEPKCPDKIQKFKTGAWGGPQKGIKENFSKFTGGLTQGFQGANDWLNEVFPDNTNVSGAYCYTGPYECGSPQVVFFGGGGSGASANAIVNGIGQVIGVNLLSGGTSYKNAPFVSIVDPAGCGVNASAYAIIDNDGKVIKVVITNPGYGYSDTNLGGVPVINSFIGTPNPVQVGKSITLNWNVSNFDNLSLGINGYNNLSQAEGSVSFVIGDDDVQFYPGSNFTTKTYTLTATKNNQNSEPQVISQDYTFTVTKEATTPITETVANTLPPTIDSFTGSPEVGNPLSPGSILTLSWETTNANQVSLTSSFENNLSLPFDGSVSVSVPIDLEPGTFISYTLTATNTNAPVGQQTISQILNYTVIPSSSGATSSIPIDNIAPETGKEDVFLEPTPPTNNTDTAVSQLRDIIVFEGGIDYDPNDEVVIVGGNNGAELKLVTNAIGQVVAIDVITPGYGFTTIPEIEINSTNGVGARFLATLDFIPLDKFLSDQALESLDPTKLVKVIDCIYK